jgi:hypothetical protein
MDHFLPGYSNNIIISEQPFISTTIQIAGEVLASRKS